MDDMIIENNGEGYEVGCDCCDMLLGWVPVADELPKRLALCNRCREHKLYVDGCTTETLRRAAGHGDQDAQEALNRRSVRDNGDGTASFVGPVPF